jgi:hypothetical protein
LKQIDFEFYKSLESAVSKRMYRFLDKRFYRGPRLEFSLRTFACEHIGLAKKYHNGELKRVLGPAIAELEAKGFLKEIAPEGRFVRRAKGEWSIVLVKETAKKAPRQEDSPMVKALIDRGISRNSALSLWGRTSEEKIREKLALFDWLRARADARVQRSPAGFLYRAIFDDFALPEDYIKAKALASRKVVPIRRQTRTTPSAEAQSNDRSAIDAYWTSLPPNEQERIEAELVSKSSSFLREQYLDGQKERGPLFQVVRQAMIDGYVCRVLSGTSA